MDSFESRVAKYKSTILSVSYSSTFLEFRREISVLRTASLFLDIFIYKTQSNINNNTNNIYYYRCENVNEQTKNQQKIKCKGRRIFFPVCQFVKKFSDTIFASFTTCVTMEKIANKQFFCFYFRYCLEFEILKQ